MLIITRRAGERIMVGDDVVVEVMEMVGNSVRIGISAPRSVPVRRRRSLDRAAGSGLARSLTGGARGRVPRPVMGTVLGETFRDRRRGSWD